MAEDVGSRFSGDTAISPREMELQPLPGRSLLDINIFLAVIAASAAIFSRWLNADWHQQFLFAMIMAVVVVGLGLSSRWTNHELNLQVLLSVTIYAVVWIASCGYMLGTIAGPALGPERTALLYATCITLLLAFTAMLVSSALRSREQYYCLGLTLSIFLAGMLLPIAGQRYIYPLAHCLMAVGFLACFAIQWRQIRKIPSNASPTDLNS